MIPVNITHVLVLCTHNHLNPFTAMPQYWNIREYLFESKIVQTSEQQSACMNFKNLQVPVHLGDV
jgi:hypothetical protein